KTPKRRGKAKLRSDRPTAKEAKDIWAVDFVHDQLFDGAKIRASPSWTCSVTLFIYLPTETLRLCWPTAICGTVVVHANTTTHSTKRSARTHFFLRTIAVL